MMSNNLRLLPLSIASISASVSLLRMQSISWRCERSPALSRRRRPATCDVVPVSPVLGRALRPSKRRISRRSTSLIVSRTHLETAIIIIIQVSVRESQRPGNQKVKSNHRLEREGRKRQQREVCTLSCKAI